MKAERFAEIVTKRAQERVDDKIREFKNTCRKACDRLFGETTYHDTQRLFHAILASDTPSEGWPTWLWENEEALVTAELLATMDEFQKALIAEGKIVNTPAPSTNSE